EKGADFGDVMCIKRGGLHRKALRPEIAGKGIQQGLVAAVDEDMRARARQRPRHRLPQMAPAARNKCDFSVQPEKILRHETRPNAPRTTLPAQGKQLFTIAGMPCCIAA